jgi:hypothetical protein
MSDGGCQLSSVPIAQFAKLKNFAATVDLTECRYGVVFRLSGGATDTV